MTDSDVLFMLFSFRYSVGQEFVCSLAGLGSLVNLQDVGWGCGHLKPGMGHEDLFPRSLTPMAGELVLVVGSRP